MSHISLVKIKLKNVSRELLRQAVLSLAKELNAEVVDKVVDYYGRERRVEVGLKNNVFHRGVGVDVDEQGNVKFVGDFYFVRDDAIRDLERGLIRHYTAVATATALRTLGYQVSVNPIKEREQIYVHAVRW